jgi:hypothetical protein
VHVSDRDLFEVSDLGHVVAAQDQGQGSSVLGGHALSGRESCGLSCWFGNCRFDSVYELTPPLGSRPRRAARLPPQRDDTVGNFMLGRIRSQADDPPQSQ